MPDRTDPLDDLLHERRLIEASALAEERERFYYFVFATAVGSLLMALGYGLLGNWPICLTGLALAAAMLALRTWSLHDGSARRLRLGVQVMTAVCLVFIFWQVLGLREAVAAWYLPLLPLGISIFCGNRAGFTWVGITVVALFAVAWAEQQGYTPRSEQIPAPMVVVTRCVLTLIITVFGMAARRTRDQHIQELSENVSALRRAQQEAERANAAKSAFLATMSHELRTPLNAVIGLNSLMLESTLPAAQRQQAELACQAGEGMLELINEILDFSRIESGRLELDNQVFSPRQLMEECLALVGPRASAKGLALRSEIEVPLELYGDTTRLRQLLLNLLTNAIKFTSTGEVVLRCCEHAYQRRSWLYIEVRDTGIGIAPDALSRIFQPFEQADASTTRLFGGTGLGLAICKGLVAAMGGRIGVNSTPGQGSTFWLELPFAAPPPERPRAAPAPAARTPVAGAARILLAEDNPTNQYVARQMFEKLGYQLDVVNHGQAAVDAARRHPYDLILMDCNMPVLDGFSASRAIRAAEPPGQRTPIVAMTALAFKGDREKCLAAGMDDYLTKPVRLHELSRMLGRWLAAPTAARSQA